MIEIKKLNLQELNSLVEYLLQNQDKVENIINDFGEVINDNGHDTVF